MFTVFAVEKCNFNKKFWLKLWNYGNFVVISSEKGIILKIFPKIGSFSKKAIEWKVMTQMFCNFYFAKCQTCQNKKTPCIYWHWSNWLTLFQYFCHKLNKAAHSHYKGFTLNHFNLLFVVPFVQKCFWYMRGIYGTLSFDLKWS